MVTNKAGATAPAKNFKDMIQEFIDYQQTNKGLSEQTLNGYSKDLKHFARWARPQGLRWSVLTPADLDRYVAEEKEQGYKPRTIKKRVEVVRLLLEFCRHRGYLTENVARYTQTPRWGQELPKAADKTQVLAYLSQPAETREAVIIHIVAGLILETGMRIGEVLDMRGEDIDTAAHTIFVRGKGAKERIVIYGKLSEGWCKMMAKRSGAIFGEFSDIQIRYMMYREMPTVHPHALRHTFAMTQLEEGMRLTTLAGLLGHKNTATTQIYAQATLTSAKREYKQIN